MKKEFVIFSLFFLCCDCVPRPVTVAAIFDHDSDMKHDLMFVNALKVNSIQKLLIIT